MTCFQNDSHTAPTHPSLALVTGATSGIGRAIADELAHRGIHIVAAARSAEALEERAKEWRKLGVCVHTCAVDLTRLDDINRLWDTALAASTAERPLDIIVNNAGFGAFGADDALEEERLAAMLRLNGEALMRLTHRAAVRFKAQKRGRILNIASTAAFQSIPWFAQYAATKSYVLSYSEALSFELAGTGVTVTCCCPGPVRTNFGRAAGLREDSPFDRAAADAADVARLALDAALDGRPLVVAGGLNRFGAILAKLAPRRFAARIAGSLLARMR